MIIDSHCHLTYEPMSLNLKDTIDRANKDGVKYILTISTEDKSYEKILSIISRFKNVFGTYGIHPHEAKLHKKTNSQEIININLSQYTAVRWIHMYCAVSSVHCAVYHVFVASRCSFRFIRLCFCLCFFLAARICLAT